jgi:hypothetical protein
LRTFAEKSKTTQQGSSETAMPGRAQLGPSRDMSSILSLHRTIGIQGEQRLLQTYREKDMAGLADMASVGFGHDFSRIPIYPRTAGTLQAKFAINRPGDHYEQEADDIAERVMRTETPDIGPPAPPAIQRLSIGFREELAAKDLQRFCTECEGEQLHRKAGPAGASVGGGQALRRVEARVDAVSGGQPLSNKQRAFFEPRFGVDFSRVRIHADGSADAAARALGAAAFTRGSDIVFREDQYRPHTFAGRQLLAHELTHVVQQGSAPSIQHRSTNESGETHLHGSEVRMGVGGNVLQCFPGDDMEPPGDCTWTKYILLRGGVGTAKAIVSMLGACSAGDSCLFLATKIAAITAEIAARVALNAACFRGGDEGHRVQVRAKVNMLNRCYNFFSSSNCPPELVAAMAIVVERAREVIAAAAVVVAIALVVALIAAIIALAEVIAGLLAAAAAAAAEGAAAVAAAAAVIALLTMINDNLSPEGD